jgi:pSer/pThr/pTyr-binding forkhead associated (FHA) protein
MELVLDGRADSLDLDPPVMRKLRSSMDPGAYSVSNPQLALRFISGKYQGGEFPIRMEREIVIGRSSELDMVLVEDMVSRKHAKINASNGQVIIQDLGSTNGTFVNRRKISAPIALRRGDKVQVGVTVLEVVR